MFGRIADIVVRPFQPYGEGVDLAKLFTPLRRRPYAMLLLSGGDLDCASHSLMGWEPYLVIRSKGDRIQVLTEMESIELRGNPFEVLDDVLASWEIPDSLPVAPFSGGGLGFLAYDLKNHLERLRATAQDDLGLP